MTDDRISDYLHDRAAAIELPPASSATVVRRARRRRVRRGAALGVSVITVAASAIAVTRGDRDGGSAEVSVASTAVVPTALDWSMVEPTTGLGTLIPPIYASTDDGTVYSLSTAPGVPDPSGRPVPRQLYRSDDGGADWTPVDLPGDFSAGSLASGGSQLYAVGTSPAGGGIGYRLATSGDGGATWSSTDLPAEAAALVARHPDSTAAFQPSIAVRGDTVVVSASVAFNLDVRSLVPGIAPEETARLTDEGALVGPMACAELPVLETPEATAPPSAGGAPTTVTVPPGPDVPTTVTVPPGPDVPTTVTVPPGPDVPTTVTVPPGPDVPTTVTVPPSSTPCTGDDTQTRTYTWDELGVDDEVRDLALAGGRTFVFVSQAGGDFTLVDIGAGAGPASQVVAGDEGFTLLLTRTSSATFVTEALASSDGVSWTPAGELQGMVQTAGVVGGRAAVALADETLNVTIELAQADGSWLTVDPTEAIAEAETTAVDQVAFGPLGWAASVRSGAVGQMDQTVQAVHSLDGTTMSLVPLGDVLDVPARVSLQPAVTADAVLVRVKDLDQQAGTQEARVVVGTPAG